MYLFPLWTFVAWVLLYFYLHYACMFVNLCWWQFCIWPCILLPLVRECYMHAMEEQMLCYFFRYSKKLARVFCNLCCRKFRGIIGFIVSALCFSVYYREYRRATKTEKRFKWKLNSYQAASFVLRPVTWWRGGPLVSYMWSWLFLRMN